jgi:hypothetical protein
MRGRKHERIEAAVDRAAAAVFGAAAGLAGFTGLRPLLLEPQLSIAAAASGGLAFLLCVGVLRRVSAERPRFQIPVFELPVLDLADVGELLLTEAVELVLTDADRLQTAATQSTEDELILDDILAKLGPDSRVVRLFDRAAMPTAGELNARIERHLRGDAAAVPPPAIEPADASQALHEALAELRRSMR